MTHTVACSRQALILSLPLLLICVACQPTEQISTYEVERTTPPLAAFDPQEVADQLDHTLAAMVPQGETVWFFKLTGKGSAIDRHREEFTKFLTGLKPSESSDKPVKWDLPKDWTERGPSEMRLATLLIPDPKGDLEISVSSLPLADSWEDFVMANVNRWLGQLGQGPLSRQKILNLTKSMKTAAGPATVIELAGVMKASPAMNPHGGIASQTAEKSSAEEPVAPPATSEELTYKAPPDWQPGQTSAMRKAAFRLADADRQAEVTVITLPAAGGPQVTDVQANVERWAGQVALPADTDLAKLIEPITIDGTPGSYVRLMGPEAAEPRLAMLAAMVVNGEKVWFFKLFGETQLVDSQTQAFREFVESVQFSE